MKNQVSLLFVLGAEMSTLGLEGPGKGIDRLRIADQRLFFQRGEEYFTLHLVDGSEEVVPIEGWEGEHFDVNRTRLTGLDEKGIIILKPAS